MFSKTSDIISVTSISLVGFWWILSSTVGPIISILWTLWTVDLYVWDMCISKLFVETWDPVTSQKKWEASRWQEMDILEVHNYMCWIQILHDDLWYQHFFYGFSIYCCSYFWRLRKQHVNQGKWSKTIMQKCDGKKMRNVKPRSVCWWVMINLLIILFSVFILVFIYLNGVFILVLLGNCLCFWVVLRQLTKLWL